MPTYFPNINDDLKRWALEQPMFWLATAPTKGKHISLSPKGLSSSTFTILDSTHCAFIDQLGSGCETLAHINENGRVTLCWCSFDKLCRILRFYCTGTVIEMDDPRFEPMLERMGQSSESQPGARAVLIFEVWKVSSSCGFSIPLLEPQPPDEFNPNASVVRHFKDRDVGTKWYDKMNKKDKLDYYRHFWCTKSLDGLPGLRLVRRARGENLALADMQKKIEDKLGESSGLLLGIVIGVLFMMILRSQTIYGQWTPTPELLDSTLIH